MRGRGGSKEGSGEWGFDVSAQPNGVGSRFVRVVDLWRYGLLAIARYQQNLT